MCSVHIKCYWLVYYILNQNARKIPLIPSTHLVPIITFKKTKHTSNLIISVLQVNLF